MNLNNYIPNGPLTVIADDGRDPHVSWLNHLERAGRGGVDLVAEVGTPIYAPTAGVMDWRRNDGSAGNSCRFWHRDNTGWADVFSHLSSYVGHDVEFFEQGELIAYSGNSGGVTQHLHRHLLDPNGVRRNPWDYFTPSAAAGGTTTIIGDIMATGIIVRADDGPEPGSFPQGISRGDVFYLDRGTAVHIGNDEDVDRAERLIGRGKAATQKIAEINTFCALFNIPGGTLRPGVKYFA